MIEGYTYYIYLRFYEKKKKNTSKIYTLFLQRIKRRSVNAIIERVKYENHKLRLLRERDQYNKKFYNFLMREKREARIYYTSPVHHLFLRDRN